MEGNWNGAAGNNKIQYNGKEWNDDFGLGWNDYGARFYDPAVARWGGIDALSEKYSRWSPYNYALNNPVKFIDPDGNGVENTIYLDVNTGEEIHRTKDNLPNAVVFVTDVAGFKSVKEKSTAQELRDNFGSYEYRIDGIRSFYNTHMDKITNPEILDNSHNPKPFIPEWAADFSIRWESDKKAVFEIDGKTAHTDNSPTIVEPYSTNTPKAHTHAEDNFEYLTRVQEKTPNGVPIVGSYQYSRRLAGPGENEPSGRDLGNIRQRMINSPTCYPCYSYDVAIRKNSVWFFNANGVTKQVSFNFFNK